MVIIPIEISHTGYDALHIHFFISWLFQELLQQCVCSVILAACLGTPCSEKETKTSAYTIENWFQSSYIRYQKTNYELKSDNQSNRLLFQITSRGLALPMSQFELRGLLNLLARFTYTRGSIPLASQIHSIQRAIVAEEPTTPATMVLQTRSQRQNSGHYKP